MPRSSRPRRKPAAPRSARTGSRGALRKTDPRQAAPVADIRPRGQRFGDGRPPRLPGRTGGR
jgi:hypothetical protein